jgi:glucose/mannose-6-phosphate isomerase
MPDLDDPIQHTQLDPQKMRERIGELPQQCADAWQLLEGWSPPDEYRSPTSVIVLGMGGSAIGGALLSALVADECRVPILSVGGYDVPAHVGADALVIASSYSGNTEETLSALAQPTARRSRVLAVTTGGKLADLAAENEWPAVRFSYESQPRAALGFSFTLLLGILCRLGLVRPFDADLEEGIQVMRSWQGELAPHVPTQDNAAKRLAWQLVDRLPVVYGAGFLAPVARRWKGQFNENGKNWAFWEELPELNHNAVVGYGIPKDIRDRVAVLQLRSVLDHPRVQARWEATRELLENEGVAVEAVWGRGRCQLAQMLSLIHLGDYTSYYLSLLNGADPTPVRAIEVLKRRLAEM